MTYLAMNLVGIFLLFVFDYAALKRVARVKPLVWISANVLLISSVILMAFSPDKFSMPLWTVWLGWILLPFAVFLKAYPLLIALPFRRTYMKSGVGDELVTTGAYALVRCPWIHSMILILVTLILISDSWLLLISSPIIILANILLAVVQNKFLFDKMFPGYGRYRQETPMLLPNKKSISAFLRTIRPDPDRLAAGGPGGERP